MTFNDNAERCVGQRYVFQCSHALGELNASASILKYPDLFRYNESVIPNWLGMDPRPGRAPVYIPPDIQKKASVVAVSLFTLVLTSCLPVFKLHIHII